MPIVQVLGASDEAHLQRVASDMCAPPLARNCFASSMRNFSFTRIICATHELAAFAGVLLVLCSAHGQSSLKISSQLSQPSRS
jgi:hypothetical protein